MLFLGKCYLITEMKRMMYIPDYSAYNDLTMNIGEKLKAKTI